MNDLEFGLVFDVKNGRFKSEVKENAELVKKLGNAHQVAAGKSRQFGNELDKTEQKLFRTNKVAQAVTLSLASMATGFSVGLLFNNISDTTQKFQVLRATLETATGGIDEAADAFSHLQVFASQTPFSVEEAIQAFIKLKNLGLDPTQEALGSYGNTASAMGKSLDQFIEAVADASVAEFERLKEFGIKAKNQGDTITFTFRKMKTEVANNAAAIEEYLQSLGNNEFAGAMERRAQTYDGALSNMADSWDQLVLKISDDGVGNAMETVVRGITANLDLLGNSTDEIATVFQVGLVVASGHAINALTNKTAAIIKDTVATRSAAQADILRANAEIKLATTARITAQTSLQAAAAENRLTIARNNLTLATAKLSAGTRILGLMSGVVGGLPGLLTLAGFAMYSFATDTSEAADQAKRLNEENAKLNPFANYTFETATGALQRYRGQLEVAQQMAEEAQTRFINPFFKNVTANDVNEANQEVERLQNSIAALQQIVGEGKKPETKDVEQPKSKKELNKLANDFAQVERSLLTEEEAINASYIRRQGIIDAALLGKKDQEQKYNNLSLALELQKDAELNALAEEKQANEQRLREEKVQAELNARELLDQHRRDRWDAEIAELQGFHSRLEAEEAAHNERVMEVKTRKTGELQSTLLNFANWQTKTESEKTSAVIGLGEKGFAAMAGQSKKAFAAYKAFSIAQTLIKTYEGATSAYAALAPIPVIGPALGIAAAGAAVSLGLSQVNAIRSQKPQGFENGGRIGANQNVIEFGERNKPEVLEFGGQNYLLNGNGGAVFNRSQLQPVGNSPGTASAIRGDEFTIHMPVEIYGEMSPEREAEFIERNHEAVYSAIVRAKNDRGEAA